MFAGSSYTIAVRLSGTLADPILEVKEYRGERPQANVDLHVALTKETLYL
jgi:hypothetical protein